MRVSYFSFSRVVWGCEKVGSDFFVVSWYLVDILALFLRESLIEAIWQNSPSNRGG